MKEKNRLISIMMLLILSSMGLTQSGGNFQITKSTIDAGGGTADGGNYSVNSTIGQADASQQVSGGNFILTGGFWTGNNDLIFKNGFE